MKSRKTIYWILFFVFIAASVVSVHYAKEPLSAEDIATRISINLRGELERLDDAAEEVIARLQRSEEIDLSPYEGFSFFIYSRSQLVRWSDHNFVPPLAVVKDTFSIRLIKSGSSDYLLRKWRVSTSTSLVAVVPLNRRFTITNNYLKPEWNASIFPQGNIAIFDSNVTVGIPVCIDSTCPFRIVVIPDDRNVLNVEEVLSLVLIALAVVLLFILLSNILKRSPSPDLAFLLLFAILLGLRWLMINLNIPQSLLPGDLFNPKIFASSDLNASLGDLLLNEVALLILSLFVFRNLFHFRSIKYLRQYEWATWGASIISGLCLLMAVLFPFVVIQTLYNNSSIVLDLSSSLRFDGLRIAATLAIILSGICAFLFSHSFIRLLIGDDNRIRIIVSFFAAALIFAIVNSLTAQPYMSSLIIGSLYFFVAYLLNLYSSLKRLSILTFTYLFVALLFLSANCSYALYHFSREDKITNLFRFGRNFLIDRDYFGEYLLSDIARKISGDVFIQTRVSTPFLSKDVVRQKIRQVFLPNYFNKYDVDIYIFNAVGEPVDNRSDISFSALVSTYDYDAYRTEYENVFFVNSPVADVSQKYLVVVPIVRMRAVSGYVVIELSLKKIIPESVYPELLVDNRFLQSYRAQEISYGVFVNGKLSYSSGAFNYEGLFKKSWFGLEALYKSGISKEGFEHIAEEDENNRIAVVSTPTTPRILALSNFSFFLVLGLVCILIFILVQGLVNMLQGHQLYFSARIQVFLNLAFFLPLIIVSVMTLSVINRSSQNQLHEEYLAKSKRFSEQLASAINAKSNVERSSSAESKLTDLAQLTNLDANLYNASGSLVASSQPLIFENNLISHFINPFALKKIRSGNTLFIERERVGTLEYFTAYAALKSPTTGELNGIVGVPFFQSAFSLERVRMNILANILNIFALLFIVLVGLSYIVTQWLTFPLSFITQSLRRTSLTKINQPLVWKADDEIGMMVKEYNQMLYKLSESKAELEQTQRERAWREIAQQVAHEIKNPLTPMKLTLQQLERNVHAGNNVPEKAQKAIASLLEQVNTLDDIASSFSSFAKMPEPVMKQLELVSLVKRIVDLHSYDGNIVLDSGVKEVHIKGDEQLLGRTFSNLIINGVQSAIPGEAIFVKVKIDKVESDCIISFQDNGKGIDDDVAERIFLPHFTTKKSGSGLGLAIAKQAIEQMGGKIWFTTSVGKGTTFFIQLPLLHNS